MPLVSMDEDKLNAIISSISQARFDTYLKASGYKGKEKALELYIWNLKICEAFYIPIQSVEVCYKNKINTTLIKLYGERWWEHRSFIRTIDHECDRNLKQVFERLANRNQQCSNSNVVADLTFGFWASMLNDRYNPTIWGKEFKNTFPESNGKFDRTKIRKNITSIVRIRNRIFHHEPIIKEDISKQNTTVMQTLYWLNPIKAEWIKPHCKLQQILRQKPR